MRDIGGVLLVMNTIILKTTVLVCSRKTSCLSFRSTARKLQLAQQSAVGMRLVRMCVSTRQGADGNCISTPHRLCPEVLLAPPAKDMTAMAASASLQLSLIPSTKLYDGRYIKTVAHNPTVAFTCFDLRRNYHTNSSTSHMASSRMRQNTGYHHTGNLGGRKYKCSRLCSNDSNSTGTAETSDETEQLLPSDSADSEADVNTIEALDGTGTKELIPKTADVKVIDALEGKRRNVEEDSNQAAEEGDDPGSKQVFPSGDLVFKKKDMWNEFLVRCRLLIAFPWQRVKKGSVLYLKLSGEIPEQYQGRFMKGLSLPQICQNLIKAAHDPRIAGVALAVEPLGCGWGKLDEIRRHLEYFKQSGKFLVGYMEVGGEKEYYLASTCSELYAAPGAYISLLGLKVQGQFLGGVLEKVGVQPQVQRIGKYKSFGDQLMRKDMSDANREMLTALLDDIYTNFVAEVSRAKGKTKEDVEALFNAGVFKVEDLKEGGWITGIKYVDELEDMLKERLGIKRDDRLPTVEYRKYNRVKLWSLGLTGGGNRIAIIRAAGSISRKEGGGIGVSSEGIASETFIEKIRFVREAKQFKAVIIRIDSGGGDALASDLMWREIKLLAEKKPVIASMADVAASGGYYMAMGAGVILAEELTITGSIGVVTAKFNLGELYERVGFAKEYISRGKFAELDADQRPFKPEEEKFFKESAMNSYTSFRNKAALSRSMAIEKMEAVAQGRVWTGKAALERGLVDAIGGISRAVAIAKQKAGIDDDQQVTLVELSKRQASPLDLLRGGASAISLLLQLSQTEFGTRVMNTLAEGVVPLGNEMSSGVQACMDPISVDGLGSESVKQVSRARLVSENYEGPSTFWSLITLLTESFL